MGYIHGIIHKTRFAELGFTKIEPGCWSFVDVTDRDSPNKVGSHYPSREQLVSNIERYAAEYGCEGADKTLLQTRIEITPSMLSVPVTRIRDTIFIPLPPELWRRSGCVCPICKADGTGGYYDTLAVSAVPSNDDRTWTVHYPELHYEGVRKAHAYLPEAK